MPLQTRSVRFDTFAFRSGTDPGQAAFTVSVPNFFSDKLSYSYEFKLIYLILIVIFTFFVYLASSFLTKAFKLSDIKLN